MIGKIVQLKEKCSKWYLNHPEIYINSSGNVDKEYEQEILINLMCCFGVPVYGKVKHYGNEGCVYVVFKVGKLKKSAYFNSKDFTVIK